MSKYKIAFVGTPKFAVPSLTALLNDNRFEIKAVISQPDMPSGRSMELTPTPVKVLAEANKIPVFQPQKISQIIDELRAMELDAIVVVAYAQIIPESVLNLPKFGCINVHGSLLPKYRGASVLQAPILNNEEESGVTIMLMDKTLDTGPILKQRSVKLSAEETAETLSETLSSLGSEILADTIVKYFEGEIKPQAQDNSLANYVGRLEKKDGIIDWSLDAKKIECFSRAMFPWPSAWTWLSGKQVKILKVDPLIIPINSQKPGKTFIYNSNLAVQCGHDSIIVRKLQLEGKKPMAAEEFLRGYNDFIGTILG